MSAVAAIKERVSSIADEISEDMPPKDYRNLAYYEKWLYAMRRMLVEQGVLSDAEIDAKVAEIKAGLAKGGAA